jgi:hypothetical protein
MTDLKSAPTDASPIRLEQMLQAVAAPLIDLTRVLAAA